MPRATSSRVLARLVAVLLVALCGCDRATDAPGQGRAPTARRIVSLSPALSRMLVDLGLGDEIVGRTPYCTALPDSVPVVGDLRNLPLEDLVRVRPTHVVVQTPRAGVDPALVDLAGRLGWHLESWAALDDLDDIARVLAELPTALAVDESERAELAGRAGRIQADIDAAVAAGTDTATRWRGRVLLVHATDPVGVYGTETYLDDVLGALGAENAAPVRGWGTLSLEDVVRLDPEAIVMIAPGARVDADTALGPLADLDVEAVRDGRVALLRDPEALLPSTSVRSVARELAAVLERWSAP